MEDFTFVFIPSNDSSNPEEIKKSSSGGLEDDELQKYAKKHFQTDYEGHARMQSIQQNMHTVGKDINEMDAGIRTAIYEMAATLDIITLQLPSQRNNFIGVSLYCDANGVAKEYKPNTRATRICHACGHINVIVYGDAFISRFYDDERFPWKRLNLTLDEIDIKSDWIQVCKKENSGKDLRSYTSAGQLNNIYQSCSTYKPSNEELSLIGEEPKKEVLAPPSNLSWNQTEEEIEIRLHIHEIIKAKQIQVNIKPKNISVVLPHINDSLPKYLFPPSQLELQLFDGAELYGKVIASECSWSIIGSDKNRELVITLTKANTLNWLDLFHK